MGKQCIVPVSCPMPAALTPGISPSLPVPMPGTMLSGTINPFVMPLCPYGGLFPTPVFGMQWSGLTAQPGIVGGQSVARFPALDKTGLQLFPGPLQHAVVSPPGPTWEFDNPALSPLDSRWWFPSCKSRVFWAYMRLCACLLASWCTQPYPASSNHCEMFSHRLVCGYGNICFSFIAEDTLLCVYWCLKLQPSTLRYLNWWSGNCIDTAGG